MKSLYRKSALAKVRTFLNYAVSIFSGNYFDFSKYNIIFVHSNIQILPNKLHCTVQYVI